MGLYPLLPWPTRVEVPNSHGGHVPGEHFGNLGIVDQMGLTGDDVYNLVVLASQEIYYVGVDFF